MPLGSSSAAPVTRPGPRLFRKPTGLSGPTLAVFVLGSASIVMSFICRWHQRCLTRSYEACSKKTKGPGSPPCLWHVCAHGAFRPGWCPIPSHDFCIAESYAAVQHRRKWLNLAASTMVERNLMFVSKQPSGTASRKMGRLLGRHLGEVIRDQHGQAALDRVEGLTRHVVAEHLEG